MNIIGVVGQKGISFLRLGLEVLPRRRALIYARSLLYTVTIHGVINIFGYYGKGLYIHLHIDIE